MLNTLRLIHAVSVLLALIFVWHTVQVLPEWVVSGRDWHGLPRGHMRKFSYLALQFGLLLGLPLLVVAMPLWLARRGGAGLNLPNRDYWFAPERQADAIRRLATMLYLLAIMLTLLLCWTHGVNASLHEAAPSLASSSPFVGVIAVFTVAMLAWVAATLRQFRRD
jgi:hypothetical protein